MRQCPDGSSECIAPKQCRKTKPCWWLKQKRDHEIIAGQAKSAGEASVAKALKMIEDDK